MRRREKLDYVRVLPFKGGLLVKINTVQIFYRFVATFPWCDRFSLQEFVTEETRKA